MSEESEDKSSCKILDSNALQSTDRQIMKHSIPWNGQNTLKDG